MLPSISQNYKLLHFIKDQLKAFIETPFKRRLSELLMFERTDPIKNLNDVKFDEDG